jgi:tetratricopeptide (TPR) repeat protein
MEGLAAMQAGDYSEALSLLDKSLALQFDLQPTIRDTLLTNRAFLLSHEGNFEDAIEALSAYVHGVPDPALLKALGIAALRRRWLPSEIPAADSDLITAAGRVEFALLASDPAVQQLAAALATQFPDVIGVHYLVGFVMFQQNTPRAEREFRQELAIDPGDLAACSMLAYSLIVEHRDLSSAQTLARRAVDAEPKNAGFQYVLGRVLDAQGAYEEAVPVLEAAVKLKPDNVEYHIELAVACAAAGRAQQAVEERRRALELKFGHAG